MATNQKKTGAGIDLTQGEPLRLLVRFAIPMFIGAIFQLLYNMVDTIVLGKFVSPTALAAVGATASTTGLIMMLSVAISNGLSILLSQAWGAKDDAQVRRIMGLSCSVTLLASAIIMAFSLAFARPLMQLLKTPEDIIEMAVLYVRITCGFYIAQMVYNTSAALLRAIGDSRTPLYFLIFCSLLNIVLDLAFVLLAKMDVAGVAIATVLSQCISAVLCCAYMWKKYECLRFSPAQLAPEKALRSRFAKITLPMLFQHSVLSIGTMVITSVINSFGSTIVAAYTVGNKVESMVVVTFSQVAFSFSIYAGQNYGAKKLERIDEGLNKALVLLGGLVAFSMAAMLLFGRQMCLLFVNAGEEEIIVAALKMIRIEAIFLPVLCAIWLYNSALRGLGRVNPTVISSILELCSKIGFSIALSALFGYGGIWIAAPLGWVIGLIPSLIDYYRSPWRNPDAVKPARQQKV